MLQEDDVADGDHGRDGRRRRRRCGAGRPCVIQVMPYLAPTSGWAGSQAASGKLRDLGDGRVVAVDAEVGGALRGDAAGAADDGEAHHVRVDRGGAGSLAASGR